MAEVKWIKLTTDMFDNRKIKHLRRLPDGDSIVLIWVMLLTMAGRCNAGGMIFLTENIPYTPKMLADELDFEESTVILALNALEDLNMVSKNYHYSIAGWEEYQNIEGMEKIRESKRLAQARWRAKQSTVDSTVDSTRYLVDHADIEEDKEIDKEVEKKSVKETTLTLFHRIKDDYYLSFDVISKLEEWFEYKKARKDSYTEIGLKALLRKVENNVGKYGAAAVCELIDESMANNWKGIIFDRIKPNTINQKKVSYSDSIKNRVSDVDNW